LSSRGPADGSDRGDCGSEELEARFHAHILFGARLQMNTSPEVCRLPALSEIVPS
jgi:hypothetical protein